MTIQTICARDLGAMIQRGDTPTVIDVRTPVEFAEVHAAGAANVPLDRLDVKSLLADRSPDAGPIYVICKSGKRAAKACDAFLAAGYDNVISIEGGTDAWQAAGLPVVRQNKVIPLERQVRIAAGTLVLIGVILAATVHPYFIGLSAFVGAGLVFAGITNFCGMGLLLARMPWNRQFDQTCSQPCCK